MKITTIISFWLITITLALTSCLGGSKPDATVKDFFNAVKSKDAAKAVKFYHPEYFNSPGMKEKLTAMLIESLNQNGGFKSIKIINVNYDEYNDSKASVDAEIIFKNGIKETNSFELELSNGKWYFTL